MQLYRVLLVDDHEIISSLCEPITAAYGALYPGINIDITFVESTEAALDRIQENERYHLLLVDLFIGHTDQWVGTDFVEYLASNHRDIMPRKFAVLSGSDDPSAIVHAYNLGASGYLLKTMPLAELCSAIHQMITKGKFVSEEIQSKILLNDETSKNFTPTEQLIIEQLLCGKTEAAISDELDIQLLTVQSHIRNVVKKSNSQSLIGALLRFLSSEIKAG